MKETKGPVEKGRVLNSSEVTEKSMKVLYDMALGMMMTGLTMPVVILHVNGYFVGLAEKAADATRAFILKAFAENEKKGASMAGEFYAAYGEAVD